jgi:hypothetical protein
VDLALTNWHRFVVDGGVLLALPEAGLGRIRVRERQPRTRLKSLVDTIVRDVQPGATAALTVAPRPLTTREGEAAAFFSVTVRQGELMVARSLGVILGDDSFTIIDGRAERPEVFARVAEMVEALTVSYPLAQGSDRMRRVWYAPPPGWRGLARVHSDVWLAPDHPRAPGQIVIFRARPTVVVDGEAAGLHARLHDELTADYREVGEREPVQTAHGLGGELWHHAGVIDGRPRRVAEAFLDGGWVRFRLRLVSDEASLERDLAIFASVIESVRPLPDPRAQPAASSALRLLWPD